MGYEEQLPGQLDVFQVIKHKEKVLKEIEDKVLNEGIKLIENKWEVF